MKKIIVSLLFTIVLGFITNAQTNTAPPPPSKVVAKPKMQHEQHKAAYACPKCFHITKEQGECNDCKVAKIQLGTYYCTKCNMSGGTKPGNCSMCKSPNTQMTRKHCAKMGNTTAPKKEMPIKADM